MKRKTDNFNKFFNKKRNSAIKEQFKQEKKAAKKERKEAIERHFEEKRQARWANQPQTEQYSKPGSPKKGAPAQGKAPAGKAGPGSFRPAHAPAFGASGKNAAPGASGAQDPNLIPLNKYIAHGGICSRRDAAELIKLGKVLVNGRPVTEPGTKVSPANDLVQVNGKKVTISRNFVYILLNKPKDYITTTDDPQGRKTVLDLTRQATQERVFPVGRLDRNTSGVLLLTNDGDLAQKLAHPKHEIKKIYHVSLDKPLTKADFDKIIGGGVNLEDGIANVDVLAYADPKDKTQIGLEIHSGRNRIVRRIFEHLGYDVRGLDRVMYAGLTKKNVQRGKWRLLTDKEIRILKYLNSSTRSAAQNKAIQAEQAAYRNKKTSRDLDVDDFLENDEQPEEAVQQKSAAPGKVPKTSKAPFRDKRRAPDKEGFGKKKDFAGKKDFGGKKGFADKKEFGEKKSFTGKKDFGDKKGPGKSFGSRKETFGKEDFAPRKENSGKRPSRGGAPAASKSRGSSPGQRPAPSKGKGRPTSGRPSGRPASGRPSSRPSNRPAK
ncbi:MAG TPA: pseudouridine synthase [Puia sp.]